MNTMYVESERNTEKVEDFERPIQVISRIKHKKQSTSESYSSSSETIEQKAEEKQEFLTVIILLHGLFENEDNHFELLKELLSQRTNILIIEPLMEPEMQLMGPIKSSEKIFKEKIQRELPKNKELNIILIGRSYGSMIMIELDKILKAYGNSKQNLKNIHHISTNGCLGGFELLALADENMQKIIQMWLDWINNPLAKITDYFIPSKWQEWYAETGNKCLGLRSSWLLLNCINPQSSASIRLALTAFKLWLASNPETVEKNNKFMDFFYPQGEYVEELNQYIQEQNLNLTCLYSDIRTENQVEQGNSNFLCYSLTYWKVGFLNVPLFVNKLFCDHLDNKLSWQSSRKYILNPLKKLCKYLEFPEVNVLDNMNEEVIVPSLLTREEFHILGKGIYQFAHKALGRELHDRASNHDGLLSVGNQTLWQIPNITRIYFPKKSHEYPGVNGLFNSEDAIFRNPEDVEYLIRKVILPKVKKQN